MFPGFPRTSQEPVFGSLRPSASDLESRCGDVGRSLDVMSHSWGGSLSQFSNLSSILVFVSFPEKYHSAICFGKELGPSW